MRRTAALALIALLATGAVASMPAPTKPLLAAVEAETELETVRFGRGDSLSAILAESGVRAVDADRIGKAIQRKTNLRRMRVGREVRVLFRLDDEGRRTALAVSVETGPGRYVEATRSANGSYRARRTSLPLDRPMSLSEVAFDRDGRTVTVRRNETLGGILLRHGVDGETVDAVVSALRADFDPRGLMPGHAISIAAERGADGAALLRGIAVLLDDDRAVAVVRTEGGGFAARRTTGTALRSAGLPRVAAAPEQDASAPPEKPGGGSAEARLSDADRPGPGTDAEDVPEPPPQAYELRRTLHAGSTLMDVLLDADVRRAEADALVQSLRRVFNPRRLPAGIAVRVTKLRMPGFAPRIARLDIELPRGKRIEVERGEKGRFSSRIATGSLPPAPAMKSAALDPRPAPGEAASVETASVETASVETAPTEPASVKPAPVAPASVAAESAAESVPDAVVERRPTTTRHIEVRSGDTLMAILRRHGIDRTEADRAIQAARKLVNLRRLRIGQEIALVTGTDASGADTLEVVALRVGDDRFVKVAIGAGGRFEASRESRLALTGAPLQRVAETDVPAHAGPPPAKPKQAARGGRGEVMAGAFVAAAAPIADAARGPSEGAAAATPAHDSGRVVNGTDSAHADEGDGLLRTAVVIRKGDTLSDALARAGGTREEAEAAIVAFRKVHNPRRLQVGQTLSLSFDPVSGSDGAPRLAAFALDVAPDRDVVVTRGDDGIFLPSVVDRPLDRVLERKLGAVESSLYDAAHAADMPNQVFMEMVHIFSYDVDFQRDIQPGNRFEVLYEAVCDAAGEFVENGPLLYARLEAGERTIELFRYQPEEGPADYLDARGASVRKALMRTPINGARLSSGFGDRIHPILGYNKKHLGVDFAADTGTPIFAAGDGTISMIGRHGNFGKYIRVRHNGTYSTGYAHMSGYAKGMKRGKRVRQGQVIGYVGSTGMSTGPHLHYEVMKGNRRINPMTLKLPTGRKLEGRELAAFQQQVQKITVLLAEVPAVTRVARR